MSRFLNLSGLAAIVFIFAGCNSNNKKVETKMQPASEKDNSKQIPKENIANVYILGGQSNMQGIGKLKNTPKEWMKPCKGINFWNGLSFELLDPTKTKVSNRQGEFGPEIGFARKLCELKKNNQIYLIKHYVSGRGIHAGWNNSKWMGEAPGKNRQTFYPGVNLADPNIGLHYATWVKQVNTALKTIRSAGKTPVIRGVLWMQGEADSKHKISATTYATNLRELRRRLGEDIGTSDLPWVFGQVLPHEKALPRFTHRLEIRAQMAALDARSGKEEATPKMWMLPTENMPLKQDTVHYNAQGQMRLGTAFAETMIELQKSLQK